MIWHKQADQAERQSKKLTIERCNWMCLNTFFQPPNIWLHGRSVFCVSWQGVEFLMFAFEMLSFSFCASALVIHKTSLANVAFPCILWLFFITSVRCCSLGFHENLQNLDSLSRFLRVADARPDVGFENAACFCFMGFLLYSQSHLCYCYINFPRGRWELDKHLAAWQAELYCGLFCCGGLGVSGRLIKASPTHNVVVWREKLDFLKWSFIA